LSEVANSIWTPLGIPHTDVLDLLIVRSNSHCPNHSTGSRTGIRHGCLYQLLSAWWILLFSDL